MRRIAILKRDRECYFQCMSLYKPRGAKPYPLSHEALDLYIDCARCFFLQERVGARRPATTSPEPRGGGLAELRREFDQLRRENGIHPLFLDGGVKVKPYVGPELEGWRESFTHHDRWTNLILSSPLDEVAVNGAGDLVLIGYQDFPGQARVTALEPVIHDPLKRRIELALWMFREQERKASANFHWILSADEGRSRYSYSGGAGWVRMMLAAVKDTLEREHEPRPSDHCAHCHR